MDKNTFFKFISVIFHPVFIPMMTIFVHLQLFADYYTKDQSLAIIYISVLGTMLLPLTTILLLSKANIIKSIYVENRRERLIPIFTTGVYIFVTAKLLIRNNTGITINTYLIGIVITLSWIILLTRRYKVSLHSSSIASTVGFFIYTAFNYSINLSSIIIVTILLTGLVSTSRLVLKAHSRTEIYLGILLGIVPQLGFLLLN